MRQAGSIPSKHDAERFASYLLTLGITAKVEPSNSDWTIWIRDENQVDRSKDELQKYLAEPAADRYKAAEHEARVARREMAQKARQAQKNYVDMRNEWANPWRRRRVTMVLFAASVLVTLVTGMGESNETAQLLISSPNKHGLDDIAHGEVWRLVTPIFVHYGWLHLIFNMMWLVDLGTIIETRLGWWRYALLVLVIAVTSNLGQYIEAGPYFGGMSGVVYGLLGYAWIRGRLDPTCGLYIHPNTMLFMFGWFLVCLFNVIPGLHAANTAHGVGLAVGALLGYLSFAITQLRRNT